MPVMPLHFAAFQYYYGTIQLNTIMQKETRTSTNILKFEFNLYNQYLAMGEGFRFHFWVSALKYKLYVMKT